MPEAADPPPAGAVVDAAQDGTRLDAFVRQTVADTSLATARSLCAAGAIAVDGVVSAPTTRLCTGQRVLVRAHRERTLALGLAVVVDDGGLLVLQKPPGLAVHTGPLVDDCVADRLQQVLPDAGLCQRLDRPASGLLLCGSDREAVRVLSTAMERGEVEREYLAVANGVIERDAFAIDLPLLVTDEPQGNQPKVLVDREHGQRAVTHLVVEARSKQFSLVRLRLETGRTHQIRAHLRAIGHPLLGDPRYGDAAANERARSTHGIDRAMLHCDRLVAPRPGDGARIEARAFAEPDFARLFARRVWG